MGGYSIHLSHHFIIDRFILLSYFFAGFESERFVYIILFQEIKHTHNQKLKGAENKTTVLAR